MEQFTQLTQDKGLYKKILKEGSGPIPQEGSLVSIYYTGVLENGSVFEENRSGEGLVFRIGSQKESDDLKLIVGLEAAIKTMRKGEKAIIVMRPDYGYGYEGFLKIPAFSPLIYCVDLIKIK